MPERSSHRLVVILHADVVGSTALVQHDETVAHDRIRDSFRRFSETIEAYGGVTHEIRGDALVAEFDHASDAVSAGIAFQAGNSQVNATLEDDVRPEVRIGISLGEVVIADNTVTGAGVVLAQRLEQLADPGGMCIQDAAYQSVPKRLPFEYESLGEQEVKGFEEPVRAYRVALKSGMSIPSPDLRGDTRETKSVRRRAAGAVVVLLIVVGGGFAWWQPWKPEFEPASVERMAFPLPDKPSIAVLPFTNMSDDPKQEYFVDGMTDDLITDLSKLSGLFVIARNSTFTYKGKAVKVAQVAEELGVRYVLEGSVRRADDKLRINAQLIDSTTGGHLWADRYDRDFRDIFALQNEVIAQIVSALEVRLGVSEQARLASEPTNNLDAYDLYLRAEQARHSYTWRGMGVALGNYDRAISLDPDFAEAHAGYAQMAVEFLRQPGSFRTLPADVARKRAYESVTRALSLDPGLARAHSVLGVLHMLDRQYDEALESARKAVALNTNSAVGYANLALVLTYAGRQTEAIPAMEAALRLEPNPPLDILFIWGRVLLMNHAYARALDVLRKAMAIRGSEVQIGIIPLLLAMTHVELGQVEKAREVIQTVLRSREFKWWNVSFFRLLWAHHKQKGELDRQLDALRKAGMPEWPSGYEVSGAKRLSGRELQQLVLGRTWFGRSQNKHETFMQKAAGDGKVTYLQDGIEWIGTVSIDDDKLCYQLPGTQLGRRFCGHVYKNPQGTPESNNEYIAVDVFDVHHFSPRS